jgi:hypothetical protein
MKKYKVIILPEAKNDISNILIYLLNEKVSKNIVTKVKNLIYA